MTNWQPTPEQVDAAAQAIFDSDCTVHQDFTVTWEQADDKHIYRHNAEYALIAARAAAPEPDTTAFEAAVEAYDRAVIEKRKVPWESFKFDEILIETRQRADAVREARQRLISMYKDAAR